ncbi:hypothetical protein [Natrialba sp. PRR66]|uniref:hypothetical protein n=1 Tax=Natrialba sp. PRR66 TaxID=3098146 RepID=UPI002B1E5F60|nr:hypothetical protein [Natrialba sp. PRR66]
METEPTEPAEPTRTGDAATSSRSGSVSAAATSVSTPVPESGSASEFGSEYESKSGPGPDWIQFLLVVLTVLVLALAAIAIPALGGVGGHGTRSAAGAGNLLELGAGGNDSVDGTAETGGTARSGNGSTELGSGSESGNGNVSGGSATSGEDGSGGAAVPNRDGETSDGGRGGDGDEFSGGSGEGGESSESGFESDESGAGGEGGAGGEQSGDGETGGDSSGGAGEGGETGETGVVGENGTAGEPGGDGEFSADPAEGDEVGDEAGDEFGQDGSGAEGSDSDGEPASGEGATGEETDGDGVDSDGGSESSESGGESAAGSGDAGESAGEDGSGEETDGETEREGAASGYEISFGEPPTPGSEVEVTVTEDGDPLPDAVVSFNADPIGVTGADGTVSGTVPFTEAVTVTVEPREREQEQEWEREQERTQSPAATAVRDPAVQGAIGARLGGSPIQFYGGSVAGPPARFQDESTDEGGASNESAQPRGRVAGTERTVEMDAETTLAIDRASELADDDAVLAGTNSTVTATVEGNPIPAGTVLLDGEQVGTTDEFGTAEIRIPETRGETTIAVERDDIRAERTVGVYGLSIEVVERVPLPGRTVEAVVQYDAGDARDGVEDGSETATDNDTGMPGAATAVENATLLIDGDPVTATGADGTATVTLPVSNEATISAQVAGTTVETTLTGLYRNAAVVATVGLALVTLLGWFLRRRFGMPTATVRTLPTRVRRLLARTGEFIRDLGGQTVKAVVQLAAALERVGDWLAVQGRAALRALQRTGRRLRGLPGELAERGLAALAALHPRRFVAFIRAVLRSLRRADRERKPESASDARAETSGTESAGEPEGRRRTVRGLWREFIRAVRPPGVRTKTAGEIGRYAVERGFPERPVRTVVEGFRDAEYGESSPAEPRIERVQAAVRSVAGDTAPTADAGAETGARAAEEEGEGEETTDSMSRGEHEPNREDETAQEVEEGDRP